jgi:hypothetical protein
MIAECYLNGVRDVKPLTQEIQNHLGYHCAMQKALNDIASMFAVENRYVESNSFFYSDGSKYEQKSVVWVESELPIEVLKKTDITAFIDELWDDCPSQAFLSRYLTSKGVPVLALRYLIEESGIDLIWVKFGCHGRFGLERKHASNGFYKLIVPVIVNQQVFEYNPSLKHWISKLPVYFLTSIASAGYSFIESSCLLIGIPRCFECIRARSKQPSEAEPLFPCSARDLSA